MQEDFLHFLWKFRKLDSPGLRTSSGQSVFIIHPGQHNKLAGPDFFNAQIRLNDQLWAGNVEIHIRASDWYAHHHEQDPYYENVILHVVWHEDVPVLNAAGHPIPTLEMRSMIRPATLQTYKTLMNVRAGQFVNCDSQMAAVDPIVITAWQERLFFERLMEKVAQIESLLREYNQDWKAISFLSFLQGFGSKINKDNFFELGRRMPYAVVKKVMKSPMDLEVLLFGVAGLLNEEDSVDTYYQKLCAEFDFLSDKFNLKKTTRKQVAFFKLRPMNFPTLRLSQFATFWSDPANNFDALMSEYRLNRLVDMLSARASIYWETHYIFGKASNSKPKIVSKTFIESLILNTIIPLKFTYARYKGVDENEKIIRLVRSLKSEKNRIVDSYATVGIHTDSALDSQALLQLYNHYCTKHRCLECSVGHFLLQDK